ncbi:MAG: putative toxin-antitoxin system toxin component, PIN family [Betaproteobacteria bacterium]
MRVVLDTNVAVALVVFADPALTVLAAHWRVHDFEAVVDDATLAEFDRVLRYPDLKLDEAGAVAASRAYHARCLIVAPSRCDESALPRCADPDDQMFLRLAQRSGARWLLTRDKALLECRGKVNFRIATPEAFVPDPPPEGAF